MSEQAVKDTIFIRKLTEIILANLSDENFGVKELVREAGISNYSLTRRLNSITNKTVKQFIREVRLKKALEMLQNEDMTISEVAYKVGFGSPAYFNTCFHDFFGFSPGTVKRGDFNDIKEPDIIQSIQKRTQKKNFWRPLLYGLSGLLLLIALIYAGHILFFKNSSTGTVLLTSNPGNSIAVLPFKNLSDTSNNQYFIDGVMEDLLNNLSKIHDLNVISRSSVEQFRESSQPASSIAKDLNVAYIVEGSGQKYGNNFQLRVRLIDARKDREVWAESYEQDIGDVKNYFRIQSLVAQSIAKELGAIITPEENQLIYKVPTANLTAYDFCTRGFQKLLNYGIFGQQFIEPTESIKETEILFKKALEYDPTYALGYVGLAHVCWRKAYQFEGKYSKKFLDSALILANTALSFDNRLAEAYYVTGGYYGDTGNPKKALEEFDKAIRINPNFWTAYCAKGWSPEGGFIGSIENLIKAASLNRGFELNVLLNHIGDQFAQTGFPGIAYHYYNEAYNLHGDSISFLSKLFWLEYFQGNHKESLELLRKINAIDSSYSGLDRRFTVTYMLNRQNGEALKSLDKWLDNGFLISDNYNGTHIIGYFFMHSIGYIFAVNGKKKEANYYFDKQIEYCLESIERGAPNAGVINRDAHGALAAVYAYRGDKEKAYENLKIFSQGKMIVLWMLSFMKTYPIFDSIRNEPEFRKIVNDAELKYNKEHEKLRQWLEEQGML